MTPQPRSLTEPELQVLDVLLRGPGRALDMLREQVPTLQVIGHCACGCPTVEFATPMRGDGGLDVVAEATVEGTHDAVLLFATNDGFLASIEYAWVGDTKPTAWPDAQRLVSGGDGV